MASKRQLAALALALFAGTNFVSTRGPAAGSSLRGAPVARSQPLPQADGAFSGFSLSTLGSVAVAVGAAAVCRKAAKKDTGPSGEEMAKTIPRPEDLLESPKFPKFAGTSGGYFSKSTRERHAITWTAKEELEIEFPTGGWAIMNKGENLAYFRKKEQAICVGKRLRKMKIDNYKIFRIAKDGTVKFMHPADGVFPDKVNKGRVATNFRPFSAGQNPQQGLLKFTKYHQKGWEADALTTMFVKAKIQALNDTENLFPLPRMQSLAYNGMSEEEIEAYNKRVIEEAAKLELPKSM